MSSQTKTRAMVLCALSALIGTLLGVVLVNTNNNPLPFVGGILILVSLYTGVTAIRQLLQEPDEPIINRPSATVTFLQGRRK